MNWLGKNWFPLMLSHLIQEHGLSFHWLNPPLCPSGVLENFLIKVLHNSFKFYAEVFFLFCLYCKWDFSLPLCLLIGYYMNIGRPFILWYFNVDFISLLNSLIFFFFLVYCPWTLVLFYYAIKSSANRDALYFPASGYHFAVLSSNDIS